jgi:hypothetical protein
LSSPDWWRAMRPNPNGQARARKFAAPRLARTSGQQATNRIGASRLLRTRSGPRHGIRLRIRLRVRLRLRCDTTAADGQLDIRRDDDRHGRIRRQFGRRSDRLCFDDGLPRQRRCLQDGSALPVADAILRVEDHRLAAIARRSRRARHGASRGKQNCNGGQREFERMGRRHGADRLSREGRIALKNALPYRDADFAASRYSPSRAL